MKKRLEAELISIAHRVLKLKNKSEVDQLYHETHKLYETLTLLKFYNDNIDQFKNEISQEELEEKIEASQISKPVVETPEIETKNEVETATNSIEEVEEEVLNTIEADEEIQIEEIEEEINATNEVVVDEEIEEAKSEMDFAPIFELAAELPIENEIEEIKPEKKQISFEDLLGENYKEPEFIKPGEITLPAKKEKKESKSQTSIEELDEKPLSLNDKLAKSITIGLNDRVGIVKHLFNESAEDFNRVISQLNTFSSFEEAKDFIDEIIKPDYNNWEGKEDFAERFLNFVEQKFI
jgi:hypothetical protein